jgi:hypothetical protein
MDLNPRMQLKEAIERIRPSEEYRVIINFLRNEREMLFGQFHECKDERETMKLVGAITSIDDILQFFC